MSGPVSIKDVEDAYRKLKHHFFYDNSQLFVRYDLAQFEGKEDIDAELKHFTKSLNKILNENEDFSKFGSQETIDCYAFPKIFSNSNESSKLNTYTNSCEYSFKVQESNQLFFYIKTTIHIHLLAVLWTKLIGWRLQAKYMREENCFGNILLLNDDRSGTVSGLQFYKPYFAEYNRWRETGIETAFQEVSKGRHVGLLNLDISNFYHSVNISIDMVADALELKKGTFEYRLTTYLFTIHKAYADCLKEKGLKCSPTLLPIGLLSSGVLANWYLRQLDNEILNNIRPIYYGRYVDDILIVFDNPTLISDKIEEIPQGLLSRSNLFNITGEDWTLKESIAKGIKISKSKLNYFDFHPDHPKALLESIRKKIKENSSEYRYLPDEESINKTFDETTHVLQFRHGDSGKIRDTEALFPSKFLITKFLAANLFYSINLGHDYNETSEMQILRFFKGRRALENYAQWERVVVTLGFHKRWSALDEFIKSIESALKIESAPPIESEYYIDQAETRWEEQTKATLREHLERCVIFGAAIQFELLDRSIEMKHYWDDEQGSEQFFKEHVKPILRSSLQRHHYLSYPVFAFTDYARSGEGSLLSKSLPYTLPPKKIGIDWEYVRRFSPRKIGFHEIALWQFWKSLRELGQDGKKNSTEVQNFDEVLKIFCQVTGEELGDIQPKLRSRARNVKNLVLEGEIDKRSWADAMCIALANLKLDEADLRKNLERFPSTFPSRLCLDTIFNQITRYSKDYKKLGGNRPVDLVVFPELSISSEWIYGVCKQARKEMLAVVGGLQHIVSKGRVFNIVATLLPMRIGKVNEVIPIFRVKNHYAPAEEFLINNLCDSKGIPLRTAVPSASQMRYHLIRTNGVQFTVFNCFELTDIRHRALMRGDLDFLVACEWNADVNYFSNIVESSVRDLHCYVIQSNNAKYGDSRVISPSSTELKNIIQIKGGVNPIILVAEFDIASLRKFQRSGYGLQKENRNFKPTPAGYEKNKVAKRSRGSRK